MTRRRLLLLEATLRIAERAVRLAKRVRNADLPEPLRALFDGMIQELFAELGAMYARSNQEATLRHLRSRRPPDRVRILRITAAAEQLEAGLRELQQERAG
jgi:hypothetical protein